MTQPSQRNLRHGSTIGIIAPSGFIKDTEKFEKGVRILHELGFQTKFPRDLWPSEGYLADTDVNRAKEFNEMWGDHEVDAIIAARGGFGALRMASGISLSIVKENPKKLIGFSDITVLHTILNQSIGVETLHGPVVTSLSNLDSNSIHSLRDTLIGVKNTTLFCENIEILQGKEKATGRTGGGNLSTLISLLGTPFDLSWKKKIIILEDVAEPLFRIDRMLTQLSIAGKFDDVEAVFLGDFSAGLHLNSTGKLRHQEFIWKRLLELVGKETIVWGNVPVGHGDTSYTFPLGSKVLVDNLNGKLVFP